MLFIKVIYVHTCKIQISFENISLKKSNKTTIYLNLTTILNRRLPLALIWNHQLHPKCKSFSNIIRQFKMISQFLHFSTTSDWKTSDEGFSQKVKAIYSVLLIWRWRISGRFQRFSLIMVKNVASVSKISSS